MHIRLFQTAEQLAAAAAAQAASLIRNSVIERGRARILVATGESQIRFLEHLVLTPGIDWGKVSLFHLDEYVGMPPDHPASFRKYLTERVVQPAGIRDIHFLNVEGDPAKVCRDVGRLLAEAPIDVAFAGIGENGHLAFNDPPADFETEEPYILVKLDEACRRQQHGEGWFEKLSDVPEVAISISIRQLLKSRVIISVVPDARKAAAVQRCLEGPVGRDAPASILRTHPDVTLYLDVNSGALLDPMPRVELPRG